MINKVKLNIIYLFILQVSNYILPLITLPYIVRTIGVEKFGVLSYANVIIFYLNILIDYGFNLSATREISINRGNKKKVSEIFISVILIKFILLIISFLIMVGLLNTFVYLDKYKEIYYFTFLMLIGKVLFPIWYFQGIEKMGYITIINVLSKIFFTILIFIYIKSENDFYLIPLINSLGVILGGFIAFIISLKYIDIFIPSVSTLMFYFKDSTSLFISNVSIALFTASNTLILGIFADPKIVGIYSSIEKLIIAIKNFFIPIYQGIYPWLAKKTNNDINKFIKKNIKYVFILSFIITLFIFIYAKDILYIIYHNQNIIEYAYILQIFSLVPLFSALSMLFNYLYFNAIKAYKIRMKIFIISGVFNIFLGVILTYIYNILGITISVVITEFLLINLGLLYFFKFLGEVKS